MGPGDSGLGRKKKVITVIKNPTWCYCIFHTHIQLWFHYARAFFWLTISARLSNLNVSLWVSRQRLQASGLLGAFAFPAQKTASANVCSEGPRWVLAIKHWCKCSHEKLNWAWTAHSEVRVEGLRAREQWLKNHMAVIGLLRGTVTCKADRVQEWWGRRTAASWEWLK